METLTIVIGIWTMGSMLFCLAICSSLLRRGDQSAQLTPILVSDGRNELATILLHPVYAARLAAEAASPRSA